MIAFLDLIDLDDDKEKFTHLYEKYFRLVMWVAQQKLHNGVFAEEAMQETFLYIAKNFEKIEDVDSLRTKTYIATIANSFAIKIYNKEHRSVKLPIEELDKYNGLIDTSVFDAFDFAELSIAIDTLDDEDKNYLYLRYIYGFNVSEISKMFDISDYYVNKSIFSSIEKIKKLCGVDNNDSF